jgi:hypothetical protein
MSFILSFVLANSVYAAVFADSSYWGVWETKEGVKPSIKIEIKKKKVTTVTINKEEKTMKYSYVVGEQNHLLLEFGQNIISKSGNETDLEIYLIGGKIGKDFVLTGFFFHTGYTQEGVEKGAKLEPVTLYLVKRYRLQD